MASKPGERKLQILQTVAQMLEQAKVEKITTAALAARLDISEAALYRHFASKAQMFEGLIEFIEGETVLDPYDKAIPDGPEKAFHFSAGRAVIGFGVDQGDPGQGTAFSQQIGGKAGPISVDFIDL